jgi:hypothetical protein
MPVNTKERERKEILRNEKLPSSPTLYKDRTKTSVFLGGT